jgi:hypothetical protein
LNDDYSTPENTVRDDPSNPAVHSALEKKNRVIEKLKEEIQEYIFLDRHIKGENERLKAHNVELQCRNDNLVIKNKKSQKMAKKWYK